MCEFIFIFSMSNEAPAFSSAARAVLEISNCRQRLTGNVISCFRQAVRIRCSPSCMRCAAETFGSWPLVLMVHCTLVASHLMLEVHLLRQVGPPSLVLAGSVLSPCRGWGAGNVGFHTHQSCVQVLHNQAFRCKLSWRGGVGLNHHHLI